MQTWRPEFRRVHQNDDTLTGRHHREALVGLSLVERAQSQLRINAVGTKIRDFRLHVLQRAFKREPGQCPSFET